ncbi:IS66 family transposase [uncultured Desulfobacter sp.]|uniref:IS66 family transposase n=1 Tax=uncultured Desulfobacter sp. TaxID=240139 RepID=UPI0029F55A7B|nr:IS66 family transposase [uncultured Desulfobacter sp.]
MNKTSVREEVDRVKQEFEQLSLAGKVTPEVKVLMNSMLLVVELILSVFLEKQTRKNSKNSSLPSSQTDRDETAKPTSTGKGKGKKVSGEISNTRVNETVTIAKAETCDVCGTPLDQTPCQGLERRTKIDIVFEKVVEHIDAEIKECPNCKATAKGHFPEDMPGSLQYGNGLKAFAIHLIISQMVALNRVQKQISAMIGTVISEATLLKFVWRLYQSLEEWETKSIESILHAPSIHVDETSFRVEGKNHWIHVYSSGGITLKLLHRKRGKEAIVDLNIIPRYGGVIIHDCWASYLSYDHCGHGLCGSHLLRELTFIVDSNQYKWAINMKKLLQETCHIVSKREDKCLTDKEYANLQKRYRNILTRGDKELPEIPPKPKGKRGKIAKSDAHNLWERLKKYETAVLLFARESYVPFTNNRAERDLRMAKVKQKISGCFRRRHYAHAYCRISSYLQTMASQGINPLVAIQMALTGKLTDMGE